MALNSRTKLIVIITSALLLIAAVAVTLVIVSSRSVAVAFPAAVAGKTLFPIYAPSQLPAGYKVDQESFSNDEGVLVFSLSHDSGRSIAVTEQSVPAGFDFTSFYDKQVQNAKKVEGSQFQAVVGQASRNGPGNNQLLSVRTDDTWIMASSQTASQDELEFVARHLRKLDK